MAPKSFPIWTNFTTNTQTTGEVNLLQRGPMLVRWGKILAKRAPFLGFAAIAGSWIVYPALTPEFKSSMGIGPKVEEN